MSNKLTFKQYLDSKDKLREAIRNVPQRLAEYTVNKYCKLVVGEVKESKDYINLKPKQKVLVEWLYDDVKNPTILSIKFEDVPGISPDEEFETFWEGERLLKWLSRNSREKK